MALYNKHTSISDVLRLYLYDTIKAMAIMYYRSLFGSRLRSKVNSGW